MIRVIVFLLSCFLISPVLAQSSRQINSGDITGALGYTPEQFINIVDMGGSIGATDNSAALTAAFSLHNTTGRPIYFPIGVWKFTGTISETLPNATDSLVIIGQGADATILQFGASNGITVNYLGPKNSTHWRDLSVTTTGAGNGNAIALNQNATVANPANSALSDFTNVTIRGADGYAISNFWTTGVVVSSVSNINFINLVVVGNAGVTAGSAGVNLAGSASAVGVVYNFNGSTFNYLDKGINYGTYIQGVTIVSCNFTGGNLGVFYPTNTGTEQLTISNSQFADAIAGIYAVGAVQMSVFGNLFLVGTANNAYGIHLVSSTVVIISNNIFMLIVGHTGNFGIVNESEVIPTSITGNYFGPSLAAYWFPTASTVYPTYLANNFYPSGGVGAFSMGASATVIPDAPQLMVVVAACASSFLGRQTFITDSTTATWGATISGSGSNKVMGLCDGTNWTVMGK